MLLVRLTTLDVSPLSRLYFSDKSDPGIAAEATLLLSHKRYRKYLPCPMSRGSVVGIVTGYGQDDRGVGVRVPVRARIFTSPYRPDQFSGPPNFLYTGYLGLFAWG
jgi:hypothetical protein